MASTTAIPETSSVALRLNGSISARMVLMFERRAVVPRFVSRVDIASRVGGPASREASKACFFFFSCPLRSWFSASRTASAWEISSVELVASTSSSIGGESGLCLVGERTGERNGEQRLSAIASAAAVACWPVVLTVNNFAAARVRLRASACAENPAICSKQKQKLQSQMCLL